MASEPAAAHAPSVLVRVGEERDALAAACCCSWSATRRRNELTLETVERRESGRGLAILRDLVHEWRGHLILRAESPPDKGVGHASPT